MRSRKTRVLVMLLALVTVFLLNATVLAAGKEGNPAENGEYLQATGTVNVRTGPGTEYNKIGSLKKGTVVLRVNISGNWSEISLGENQTAYVSSSYLKSIPDADTSKLNEGYIPVESSERTAASKKSSLESLINSAELSPLKTGDQTLDQAIAAVFDQVSDEDDSTYEKFRAFYGWLVNNTKDLGTGYGVYYLNGSPYRSLRDTATVYFAKQQLSTMEGGRGNCDLYAATLVVAARHLGLDAYEGHGGYINSSGKRSPHSWMFLMLDGKPYIFDAQLEFNNTKGKADYSRFGVHGEKWDKRYVMSGTLGQAMADFGYFR